jgi:hypothetical protein
MKMLFPRVLSPSILLALCLFGQNQRTEAQIAAIAPPADLAPDDDGEQPAKITKEDGWIIERFESKAHVHTNELTLYPQAEAQPALKYRLIPDAFDMIDGNAGIYYLKALGFLEQDPARERIRTFCREAFEKADEQSKRNGDYPPSGWLSIPPSELPLGEVRDYLKLSSFQVPFVREAARRDRFNMDRNLREVDDPIAYLLPEIQRMRELARTQSLRCRLAIAEGRIDDAIAIIGQQFALSRHMGQGDFLITNLVGMAVSSIAWNDALHLVQQKETPNLFWAFASMPTPLVGMRRSMAFERQFLLQQVKVLREVDEMPRSAEYWRDFLDRLLPQIGSLASEFGLASFEKQPELTRAVLVGYVAAAYPGAKDYLQNECGMSDEQTKAYPTAQVVFLATVRFFDHWRDEYFKWSFLPFWQARTHGDARRINQAMKNASKQYGWFSAPTLVLLPAVTVARTAQARQDQGIALIQTVEAVRMYAAAHDGKLPPSLDELPVPAPIEPYTAKPIDYEFHDTHAVLNGYPLRGMRYRLVLRIAKPSK